MVKEKISAKFTFKIFLTLAILNLVSFSLAIAFYKEPFYFWSYPLSFVSDMATYVHQFPNAISSLIFSLDMFLSGFILFYFARRRYQERDGRSLVFFLLPLLAGAGYVIAGFSPDDTHHVFHVLGSALYVALLWIMATGFIYETKSQMPAWKYYLLQFILQVPIFTYAFTYFANLDISSGIQKITVIGLLISLLYSTYILSQ